MFCFCFKSLKNSLVTFSSVSVDSILLIRSNFVFVQDKEISDSFRSGVNEFSGFTVAIVFDDSSIT